MARVRISRQGFVTGKLSIEAQANTQAEVYNFGLDMCENFAIKPLGGAYKRSGTELLLLLKIGDESLKNYEFIRFLEYYYKGEKILVFLTSGSEGAPTIFGILTEENAYYSTEIAIEDGDLSHKIIIETEKELYDVSYWSDGDKFYFIIPSYGHGDSKKSAFLSYKKAEGISQENWDSEPLFPLEGMRTLAISCIIEQWLRGEGAGYFALVSDTFPYAGNKGSLRLYGRILSKDGRRDNTGSVAGHSLNLRENTVDYSEYDGLNCLFKIVKTQMYSGDRTNEFTDRFATGVYWIGGKITVLKGVGSGLDWLLGYHLDQDIYIELKNPEQFFLFPFEQLDQTTSNSTKRTASDNVFVTAFNRKKENGEILKGVLNSPPYNVVSYKGRTYIFYKSWVWGSALGKSSTNFAMGSDSDLGFCVGWGDGKVGEVNWVFPAGKIIIGTSSGIYYSDSIIQVTGGDNISYVLPEMLTNIATSKTRPVLMGQSIIFVGSDGVTIYEIQLAGENGISVSKINSHCTGIFSQKIAILCSTNDYLYAIGEDGECNVCCFANQIFTRRWFSYNFGGNAARLADMFSFNSGKAIGSFRRRFQSFGGNEVATIEHMRSLFDVYRDKASEQFFLDCAVSRYSRTSIESINNGKAFVYKFTDALGDFSWPAFFKLISDFELCTVLFAVGWIQVTADGPIFRIDFFGGKDANCFIKIDSKDLIKNDSGGYSYKIKPFVCQSMEDVSDVSLLGQPYLEGVMIGQYFIVPFFGLEILEYEFYAIPAPKEDPDAPDIFSQFLKIVTQKKLEHLKKYTAVCFGKYLGVLNGKLLFLELKEEDFGPNYVFEIKGLPNNEVAFNLKSDGEHELYISPYPSSSFIIEENGDNKNPCSKYEGEVAELEIVGPNDGGISLENSTLVFINDVRGAKGYNENSYTLESQGKDGSPSFKQWIFYKTKYLLWNDDFEIPGDRYVSIAITAFGELNGQYDSYRGLGNIYFYMSYFLKDAVNHLIGEKCQFTYDGNQGWQDINGVRLDTFILTPEMFRPLNEEAPISPLVFFVPQECIGIYLVMGIPYDCHLQTVGLEGGSLFGTSEGSGGISREASLAVLFSRGGLYGNNITESKDELYPLRYDADDPEHPEIVSRDQVSASFNTALLTDKDNTVRCMYILHDIPCNFSILNIVHDIKVSDG